MLWLQTLGNPVLYDHDGQPIGGAARHRRTIGLLSVLVCARDAGITRDKLTGLFWPDFDQKHARHSLTQALYAARKAAGRDDLFDAGEDVRLNFACIGSDLREFEQRLKAGDDAGAAELYRGTFLDGFYLRSPEFDMWLTQERARVEAQAAAALARLINRAESTGEVSQAIEYGRRFTTLRPTDANAVINVMRLLRDAGDRPAAMEEADRYGSIVRDRYDMAPDAAVVDYAEQLQEESRAGSLAISFVRAGSPGPELAESARSEGRTTHSVETSSSFRRMLGRRSLWLWSSLALASTALLIVMIFSRNDHARPVRPPLQQRTVIAPFRVAAADQQLSYLSEGMIELLATRLADDSTDRAMDAGAMIRAWRSAEISESGPSALNSILPIATQLHAERVVIGSVLGTPRRLIINATVVTVGSREVTARASVEGSADTLTALVDALARKLLSLQAEPGEPLAERMTGSLAALQVYVQGTGAYARGDYGLAQRFYARALKIDSSFALAALKLGLAAGRMADFEGQRIAFDHAWRMRRNLSEKDHAFLLAQLGPRYPGPSSLREALAAWNAAAHVAPERPEVWAGLGGVLYESQILNGVSDPEPIVAAVRRALALDPAYVYANVLLSQLQQHHGALPGAAPMDVARQSAMPFLSWWRAVSQDSAHVLSQNRDPIDYLGPANLRAIALAGQHARRDVSTGEKALTLMVNKAGTVDEAIGLLIALHSSALNRVDVSEAIEITRRMQRLRPAARAHLRLRILDAIYQTHDSSIASGAGQELQTLTGVGLPAAAADNCVLAQLHIWRGELPRARQLLNVLKTQEAETPIVGGVQPGVCTPLVEAQLSVAAGERQAIVHLRVLDSMAFTSSGLGDLAAYANIASATMHRKLNQPREALAAIRRRPYGSLIWPRYLRASVEIESELCQLAALASMCEPARQ